ncbi:MAG: pyridoxamine 5'-phosphate oxidase [Nocardioides sp.]|uniref:pyridoxamine 5'-phosphate oxidase n=1 Tax=Nocardioides sp. TaxID=35761 RepID=UPI0039E6ABD3
MSIQVPLPEVPAAVEFFGAEGYVLTANSTGAVRAAGVQVRCDGDRLRIGAGRAASANVEAAGLVTLLFAPLEAKGHTLLVDGTAVVAGDEIVITPTSGVLHRPPYHSDGPPPPAIAAAWRPGGC